MSTLGFGNDPLRLDPAMAAAEQHRGQRLMLAAILGLVAVAAVFAGTFALGRSGSSEAGARNAGESQVPPARVQTAAPPLQLTPVAAISLPAPPTPKPASHPVRRAAAPARGLAPTLETAPALTAPTSSAAAPASTPAQETPSSQTAAPVTHETAAPVHSAPAPAPAPKRSSPSNSGGGSFENSG